MPTKGVKELDINGLDKPIIKSGNNYITGIRVTGSYNPNTSKWSAVSSGTHIKIFGLKYIE